MKNEFGIRVTDIRGIMKIAEKYAKNLYSGQNSLIEQSVMDFFLDYVFPHDECLELFQNLMRPITLDELWDAIKSFLNGKTPGPDGILIEFYKIMWPVIQNELLNLFNYYLNNGRISSKIKAGLQIWIPKTEPLDDKENYRPITLLNCDYKIFNKIISDRLRPILKILIHDSQFAQPGKDINEMTCLVRDIIDDMKCSFNDSFFLSIDFRKAFDTICHDFLFQILAKYGFPTPFINLIKELFRDAGSHIFINKFRSRKVKLKSGTQQGNTISRDLFILQLNPLLLFLNSFSRIEKYKSLSNRPFLTLAYMDDANVVTQSLSSVMNVLFYTKKFEKASGLSINMSKSKGMFINKRNVFQMNDLPNIEWSESFICLKIKYGPRDFVNGQWVMRMDKFKSQLAFFKKTAFTYRAKSILSKSKLFPLLSYTGRVHGVPINIRKEINRLLFFFFLYPFCLLGVLLTK